MQIYGQPSLHRTSIKKELPSTKKEVSSSRQATTGSGKSQLTDPISPFDVDITPVEFHQEETQNMSSEEGCKCHACSGEECGPE